jgi:hypothetical protein
MLDSGFSSAQARYDNMEPPDNRTENAVHYQERLTPEDKEQVCIDYMNYVEGWALFEDRKIDGSLALIAYVESLDSFWEWLNV